MQAAHRTRDVCADLTCGAFELMNAIKTLLIICPPRPISVAMSAAITSEFPWLSVEVVYDLQAAADPFEHPVQLILADASSAPGLQENWGQLSAIHHEATPALIWYGTLGDPLELQGIPHLEWVKGIIPFNVNLDVFLSAIKILLMGGNYFPVLRHSAPEAEPMGAPQQILGLGRLAEDANGQAQRIVRLTRRESEILVRMAMGNQNKIIAAALGLSEHTVKIHIHNIINKLGVHNRTEVVAHYFAYMRQGGHHHEREPSSVVEGRSVPRDEL